jgi:hypothetical protein
MYTFGVDATRTKHSFSTAEICLRSGEVLLDYADQPECKAEVSRRDRSGPEIGCDGRCTDERLYRVDHKAHYRAGVDRSFIHYDQSLELPGYFRPTKRWDLVVVVKGQLVAALEAKSQVGPSFGNNFNNRTEEAMGSALDLWTAFREGAFGSVVRPWLGYVFLLDDCPASNTPVSVKEPHFKVFPEFRDSSYAKRYQLFCERLVLERQYDAAAFLMSDKVEGLNGAYHEPAEGLTFQRFANSLVAQIAAFSGKITSL